MVKVDRRLLLGTPAELEKALFHSEDFSTLNTSFVERHNLTVRRNLLLYDTDPTDRSYNAARYTQINHADNFLLVFPCRYFHEISAARRPITRSNPSFRTSTVETRMMPREQKTSCMFTLIRVRFAVSSVVSRSFLLFSLLSSPPYLSASGVWGPLGPMGGEIADLVTDPMLPNTLYAITGNGVFKSTSGGLEWRDLSGSSGPIGHWGLVIAPSDRKTMVSWPPFGGSPERSLDGSRTWSAMTDPGGAIRTLVIHPQDPRIVFAGTL